MAAKKKPARASKRPDLAPIKPSKAPKSKPKKAPAKKAPAKPAPGFVRVCARQVDRKATPKEQRLEKALRAAQQRVRTLREDLDRARAEADLRYTHKAQVASAAESLKAARKALRSEKR